jgi:transcription initiation factor TFIIIB Brf1 subunit/transcription initiation factor TFIIB
MLVSMVKGVFKIKECPDCASMDIVHNERRQQVVCKSCGLIYEPLTPKEEETYLGYLGLASKAPATNAKKIVTKKKFSKASLKKKSKPQKTRNSIKTKSSKSNMAKKKLAARKAKKKSKRKLSIRKPKRRT